MANEGYRPGKVIITSTVKQGDMQPFSLRGLFLDLLRLLHTGVGASQPVIPRLRGRDTSRSDRS